MELSASGEHHASAVWLGPCHMVLLGENPFPTGQTLWQSFHASLPALRCPPSLVAARVTSFVYRLPNDALHTARVTASVRLWTRSTHKAPCGETAFAAPFSCQKWGRFYPTCSVWARVNLACWEPRGRLTAAKKFLLFCTTPRISREADCELLFVAVGQFSGRSSLHGALSLIALSLPWWERRLEVLGVLVPQCHFPVSSCGWSSEWLRGLVRVPWIIRAAQQPCFPQSLEAHPCHAPHSSSTS